MIVRKHLRWQRVLRRTKGFLSYIAGLSLVAYLNHGIETSPDFLPFMPRLYCPMHLPFSVVASFATALAIFLAFRNNSAYDRWWEARKIWGGIVNTSRTIGRQATSIVRLSDRTSEECTSFAKQLVYRHLAWINALRLQLRKQESAEDWKVVQDFLEPEEFQWLMDRKNRATQLVQKQGEQLAHGRRDGFLVESRYFELLDDSLTQLYDLQGKAERIKNTPLPRQYDYFPRVFLFLFVTLLPWGMVTELAKVEATFMVIPLATCVSFMFYVLMRVGEFNEDPFEGRISDTPMSALCRTIEIDLREQLGETDLPPKAEPVDGILM